jgi:glutathione S-transferase
MSVPTKPIRLFRYELSGHSHRVELLLSLLGLPSERVDVDLLKGMHKTAEFAAKNPFLQVPVVEDGDVTLADSNAILVYLATRYDRSRKWLPSDPVGVAQVQRWLSVAAGELASGPNSARLVSVFGSKLDHERAQATANRLFGLLDAHLTAHKFLVGEAPTIADVSIYSYTACAPEGGVSLEPFPNVRAWLDRIERVAGFVPMKKAPAKAR